MQMTRNGTGQLGTKVEEHFIIVLRFEHMRCHNSVNTDLAQAKLQLRHLVGGVDVDLSVSNTTYPWGTWIIS